MNKLKIALATYALNYGGVANFIFSLSKKLQEEGNYIEIICTEKRGSFKNKSSEKIKVFNSFNFLKWIPFGRIIHAFIVGKYLKKRNFDLIINNHSFSLNASIGLYNLNAKTIAIIHNEIETNVKRECNIAIDKIVAVSDRIAQIAEKYLPQDKIHLIRNGIKIPKSEEIKNLRSRETFKILYVGRIDNWQKAVFNIPEIIVKLLAYNNNNNIQITIVGMGDDLDKMKKIVTNYNLNHLFEFTGLVEPEEIPKYYLANHILLLPSKFEGLPLTLMEAMAFGCVPIASLLKKSTDICIDDGINGFLLDKKDIEGFASKIFSLSQNTIMLEKLSKNAIIKASDNFSEEIMHQEYLNLIYELITGRNDETKKWSRINPHYFTIKEIFPFELIIKIKKIIQNKK